MDKKIEKIMSIIFCIILFILLGPILLLLIWIQIYTAIYEIELTNMHNENIKIESQYREQNVKIFNEYIEEKYGILKEAFDIEVEPAAVNIDTDFIITTGFMNKTFTITVDSDKEKIYSDNFEEILYEDEKFQHLYSAWLKKHIGMPEDENVELRLSYGDIDFKNIKSLNETYDELFENCPYRLWRIEITNFKEEDIYITFNDFRNKYYNKLNKDAWNTFDICFEGDENFYIYMMDHYVKRGEKEYLLKTLYIEQNEDIDLLCNEEQLDDFFMNAEQIKKLIKEAIPTKMGPLKLTEWEIDNKIIPKETIPNDKIIKVLEGKIYTGSVLRGDLSDIDKNNYVIDVLYYDDTNHYNYKGKPYLKNPKYMRYNIQLTDNEYELISQKEIPKSEYIGKLYKDQILEE